jgi:6-pyruvoyltetrahydropterin/6-carboxytetrahydropterin synthase
MAESYHVRVAKSEHVFSAAHFITYNGMCERLHGHNYRVSAEVYGPLDPNQYVIDFLMLRHKLREITTELDHIVILPTEHPQIKVVEEGDQVVATFEQRRWTFPRSDCRLLPIANTTAELVASYIGRRLLSALTQQVGFHPVRLRIELDECDGQVAVWEIAGGGK